MAMDDEVEVLAGGVGNAGAVVRMGDEVLRPTSEHTPSIHALLEHLREKGFSVPELLGIVADGRERLRFIPGDVPYPTLPGMVPAGRGPCVDVSLLRRFHDAGEGFTPPLGARFCDEMADPAPGPDAVPCHNDVCPENSCTDERGHRLLGLRVRRAGTTSVGRGRAPGCACRWTPSRTRPAPAAAASTPLAG